MNVGRAGEQKAYSCFIVPNEFQSICVGKALIKNDHALWWSIYEKYSTTLQYSEKWAVWFIESLGNLISSEKSLHTYIVVDEIQTFFFSGRLLTCYYWLNIEIRNQFWWKLLIGKQSWQEKSWRYQTIQQYIYIIMIIGRHLEKA